MAWFGRWVVLVTVLLAGAPVHAQGQGREQGQERGQKVLRFVPQANVGAFDPVWTTAYVTRNHGYLVWDTLFGTDASFKPQPQMVERWTVSDDQLTWRFTLRPNLRFHDGVPVRSTDAIASLKRWAARDTFGQAWIAAVDTMTPDGDDSFVIRLKAPFPLLIEGMAKLSSNVPFVMPARLAATDPFQQIPEIIGSGPFRFVKPEWAPGNKIVYERNPDYVPRSEPPSWSAGGKVVKLDRVEWLILPDPTTAAAALERGEIDWWEQPTTDLLPVLARNPAIRILKTDPLGGMAFLRFNHLQPPFDNPKLRQALLPAIDQSDYLRAMMGNDPALWSPCASFFACGSSYESDAGSTALTGPRDLARAKRLIAEAGYAGERIVLLSPTDFPLIHAQSLITQDLLTRLGLKVELAAGDWASVVAKRASREPVDKGGWSILHTWFGAADMTNPAIHPTLRGNGTAGWFGWPTSATFEALRAQWFAATDDAERKRLGVAMQEEAFQFLPYIPTGRFFQPTAIRKTITGVTEGPIFFFWNVDKQG